MHFADFDFAPKSGVHIEKRRRGIIFALKISAPKP
jgi:hypothetical protein